MRYFVMTLTLVFINFLSCGAKDKKNAADGSYDGALVNEGAVGEWNGIYSAEGVSPETGLLEKQIAISVLLYQDGVFLLFFEGSKANYIKGTYSRFTSEITFTVKESRYEAFASEGSTLLANYELSEGRLTLRFGDKRFILLGRNDDVVAQAAKDKEVAAAVVMIKHLICHNDESYTVSLSLDEGKNSFSAGIFVTGNTEKRPPFYKGSMEKIDSNSTKLIIDSRQDEKEPVAGFVLGSTKENPDSTLTVQYSGEPQEKILACEAPK